MKSQGRELASVSVQQVDILPSNNQVLHMLNYCKSTILVITKVYNDITRSHLNSSEIQGSKIYTHEHKNIQNTLKIHILLEYFLKYEYVLSVRYLT